MYTDITASISAHCATLGRLEPVLIAVSKTQPNALVEDVLKLGHRIYGENRVQEAQAKWPEFNATYSKSELHLLGPLQTNKARVAMGLFDVVHSLDRLSLAQKFSALAQELGTCPQCFVQVNIGNEPQKAGVSVSDLAAFLRDCSNLDLPIIGLMCIPPEGVDPRPFFATLRAMSEVHGLAKLSMGMSGDYLIAIEEGATHIRVGSAIFGARDYG